MVHFHKQVVGVVIIEQIPRHTGPLCHPVYPYAPSGIVYPVVPDQHINGGMDLYTGHFRP